MGRFRHVSDMNLGNGLIRLIMNLPIAQRLEGPTAVLKIMGLIMLNLPHFLLYDRA